MVQPAQDLLGCSPPSFLQSGVGSGSRQDYNHPFKSHIYPRNTHLIGKVEESIRPSVAAVHLIERLAKPSCLTHLTQEHHRGCWWCCTSLGLRWGAGAAAGMLGGNRASYCFAETRDGRRAGQARRQDRGLWRVEGGRQGALWGILWRKWLVWARLHCWQPLDWDSQWKLLLECWNGKKNELHRNRAFYEQL